MFGFYFVQNLVGQAGWPRKLGFFGGLVYDNLIVDQVIDQMLGWGASLGAGRPKLSLQMIAEMFRDRDWDGDHPPDVKMVIDGSRAEWNKAPEGGPSEVIKPWRLSRTMGKTMPAKNLADRKLIAALEELCLESIMWGLGNPDRVKAWYTTHRAKTHARLPDMQEAGLQVDELPELDESLEQCASILRDYERDIQPLPPIPQKLLRDAEVIGIGRTCLDYFVVHTLRLQPFRGLGQLPNLPATRKGGYNKVLQTRIQA
jgi:hypothetical protein